MRPLRIDLQGFTVFRDPTTVDLQDVDFFALVGPTGSGKSTVLDSICFALYGTVPRWGDRRKIENALAPSASEARVRLVFESAGVRFVATRVVRRDAKGKVSTSHAGLEQLPPGFAMSNFDLAPAERTDAGLGTVLAGTPAEMDGAVAAAIGLPYEQFISCVLLPQGEFARFLHAKPAERQEILVNLLGLHIYQRIGERAGARQRDAEAKAAATRSLLGDVRGADDAALATAEAAVAAAGSLVETVDRELPALEEANATGEAARADLTRVQREMAVLAGVRTPRGVATLAKTAASAADAQRTADAAALAAEEYEEKSRAELAAAGDRTALTRLLDAHRDRAKHVTQVGELAKRMTQAKAELDEVSATVAAARTRADKATAAVGRAQAAIETAQTADRAASLRVHLVAGEPCPVCEQEVHTVPGTPAPGLAAARAKHAQAEKAAQVALRAVEDADRILRERDRALAAATAAHDQSHKRLAAVEATLASAPSLSTVEEGLAAITAAERVAGAAAEAVRTARQAARTAASQVRQAEESVRSAWRDYDGVRDQLAALTPPPADREDLVGSWRDLQQWAEQGEADRADFRDASLAVAEAALAAITQVAGHLGGLFRAAGQPPVAPAGDPAAYRQAAALAVVRATADRDRVLERRAQAQQLADQIAEHERTAQVAKSLALHLRANQFERWLLAEALDALVLGASRILRELSGGQYDLTHDKGEFFVIDHSDASLRRGVRTLSGGETFQASLALALALSEQLAGLSTSSASLESIMLDEGFGTLDAATLDTVAATLENLASRGDRMVGVVTHVAALAERIPVRFELAKDARGTATIVRQ